MIKVAINGFGRIGRATLRIILDKHPELEVVAINDLTQPEILAHLFKYDSLYGIYEKQIGVEEEEIIIGNKKIKIFCDPDPRKLPWKELGIDVVLECTGHFRSSVGAKKHLEAGARKVIISAPAKSEDIPTYVLGVNAKEYDSQKDNIISMGSCTTNCLAPLAKILNEEFKIVKGFMTTIHSYTNDQKILDLPHKDLRRSRAAGVNIIPTTTGATKAVEKCLPELKGKLDGLALRVPTPVVSIVDFVCEIEKETSVEEINNVLEKASEVGEMKSIFGFEKSPLVSSDYKGNPDSCIVDGLSTKVMMGNLVKVLAWYDNEYGYSSRLAEMAKYISK
jgi:glyceraldehyde 3-phosphate dehydrogenase